MTSVFTEDEWSNWYEICSNQNFDHRRKTEFCHYRTKLYRHVVCKSSMLLLTGKPQATVCVSKPSKLPTYVGHQISQCPNTIISTETKMRGLNKGY